MFVFQSLINGASKGERRRLWSDGCKRGVGRLICQGKTMEFEYEQPTTGWNGGRVEEGGRGGTGWSRDLRRRDQLQIEINFPVTLVCSFNDFDNGNCHLVINSESYYCGLYYRRH